MITRSKESIAQGISAKLLQSCIKQRQAEIPRLERLDKYYRGKHDILTRAAKGRWAPNNRIVCNFPKYITDTACGYAFGNPIVYKPKHETNIDNLLDAFRAADVYTHDAELSKDLSVFGTGFELLYMSDDDAPTPKLALIDPRNAFVVYDDSVEANALFGVRHYRKFSESGDAADYAIEVVTANAVLNYTAKDLADLPVLVDEGEHYFGGVPLIEYWNNEEGMGDYEGVMSLVDSYNILMSDRVNDKERFVDAILLIAGARMPDDDGESATKMLVNRILELPEGADARYITKAMDETEVQVLADALKAEIHKLSQTPDFTDEHFSGNTSGVALKYKLLSLENLAKIKERFFISSLRGRIKLFINILSIKGGRSFELTDVVIKMNRTLPVNELETAQMISLLKGTASSETLLAMLPMIEDPKAETEAARAEAVETQKMTFQGFQSKSGDSVRL